MLEQSKILQIICNQSSFRSWPEWAQQELAQESFLRNYRSGREILPAGTPPTDALIVVKGALCYQVFDEHGHTRIYPQPAGHEEIMNLAPMLMGLPLPGGLFAQRQTSLLHIPRESLTSILTKTPSLMEPILTLLCHRVMLLAQQHLRAHIKNPLNKLAVLLLDLSKNSDTNSRGLTHIRISQDSLAAMLGLSRQSINKSLGKLADAGIISQAYGGLHIVDKEALHHLEALDSNH